MVSILEKAEKKKGGWNGQVHSDHRHFDGGGIISNGAPACLRALVTWRGEGSGHRGRLSALVLGVSSLTPGNFYEIPNGVLN